MSAVSVDKHANSDHTRTHTPHTHYSLLTPRVTATARTVGRLEVKADKRELAFITAECIDTRRAHTRITVLQCSAHYAQRP